MHAESIQQSAEVRNSKRSQYFTSLKSKKRIAELFTKGGKAFGKSLMVRYARSEAAKPPLSVVFAVSKKTGDAPLRNRIKRRLREALFAIMKASEVKSVGFDIAIIPKKEVADLDFAALCDELRVALKKLR